ncbi:neurogenic locus notch homolog protein 1-like [Ruditapes philippinarum]|uniref:neurogenic locus notch homolog protein 1-like n=1 Tax=Ruditapes philippinarum TaxID=129788 RepID=UPI00295C00EA|nr:neurogenic locus notch homolog protein 1-like [Ruditapes philippinarum]
MYKYFKGYTGLNCTDMNECSVGIEDPCHHRGICHNTVGSYSCMCLSSWNGSHCEQKVKSEIECLPGYIGDECEKPLCKPGYALNNTGSSTNYTCYCEKGWNHTHTNVPCDKDIDECKLYPNICKNGGSCSNTNGSYICYCIEPWEGENCTFYNACRSNSCANQGKCAKTGNDTDRTYKCACQLGYKGESCTLDVDECSLKTTNECVHGNCSNSIGSYNCTCETAWTSKTCNETIDITVTIEQTTKVRPEIRTTEIYRPSSKITRGKTYNQTAINKTTTKMTTLKKRKYNGNSNK